MSPPPAPNPHDTEGVTIPDHMMVFRSNEAPPPLKSSKARIKARKCTPAPPTKGDGRKRLVLSPFPEDKQLRKRIDFGDENSPTMVGSQCKGAIFPASSTHGSVEGSMIMEEDVEPSKTSQEMAIVCYVSPSEDKTLPESGEVAGGEKVDGRGKEHMLHQPRSKQEDPTNSNVVLGGEGVNLPKMDLETKPLFESCLVPCQVEGSHDVLAVGFPMQPKNDTILHLASLGSAEVLDTIGAQPLLSGGAPEEGRLTGVPYATQYPPAETLMPTPSVIYAPSIEEFPPLEREAVP